MRNPEAWQPSKVVLLARSGRYVPNAEYVLLGSRHIVGVFAGEYERVIRTHARGRLLDCGCGDVPYYEMYRRQVTETICVDWKASTHGRQHLDCEVDLNGPLPFEDARFDTVLLADVLEHIHTPAPLLAELARILAASGKLVAMVPFLYQVHEAPHDYYRYTRHALERLVSAAGLKMVELVPYGGYPDVLFDLLNKALASVPPVCRPFLALSAWASRTRLYRRWSEGTAERFPLGYCFVAEKG